MNSKSVWEELIYQRDKNNPKKIIYDNRKQFYNRQGIWKILDSNKKVIARSKKTTNDMGMLISHLMHDYASNSTYSSIDKNKKLHILFQETKTCPINQNIN